MTARRLGWLLATAALLLFGWWLTTETEWVDEEHRRPARGEARDNPVYAFEQLLRRLGMTVAHHQSLDTLPPPQARLLLLSSDWQLMPGRAEQLHQWVRRGGHLVLTRDSGWEDAPLAAWVPVRQQALKRPAPSRPAVPARIASAVVAQPDIVPLTSAPPLWDGVEKLAACDRFIGYQTLQATQDLQPAWALKLAQPMQATQATQILRVPLGQGSVTVMNTGGHVFYNAAALDCGLPVVLAATLQAEPGAVAWIYLNEKREALLPWLWHGGWIAIVALLLALAAALWRAAVRFGPRLAPAPRLRRSISEQVRGLGAYLHGTGREALLAAQQRALVEQATRSLPRFARLPSAERARAIADATGLPALELSAALTARFSTRNELAQRLQVLETARRRLLRHLQERPTP